MSENEYPGPVPLSVMMPPPFMQQYTDFPTLQAMVAAAPGVDEGWSQEELAEYIKGPEWNQFVTEHTDFGSWEAMVLEAGTELVKGSAEPGIEIVDLEDAGDEA